MEEITGAARDAELEAAGVNVFALLGEMVAGIRSRLSFKKNGGHQAAVGCVRVTDAMAGDCKRVA
jgi:hypothetical protein